MGRWSIVALVVATSCTDGGARDATPDSGPSAADLVDGADVRFSEVNYHASGGDAGDFLELVNAGSQGVQLQGWCIEGVKYCFAVDTTLPAGDFLVLSSTDYEGNLSNKGERLRLIDPLGQVREDLIYADVAPWPESADGGGHSLQRVDLLGDPSDPASWVAGEPTPGAAYDATAQATLGDVAITEVNYHPADGDPAATFVEVFNTQATAIDLDGWCLDGVDFCWHGATPLAGRTTAVVTGSSFSDQLSHSSQRLRLVDATGIVHDVARYTDGRQWPAAADGFGASLHRLVPELSGMSPGNWVSADPDPGTFQPAPTGALLPAFGDVAFAVSPAVDTSVEITARIQDATDVSVAYRVDFADEVVVPATVTDGVVSATVPGQAAGALIRFRLIGTGPGGMGTWPRQGDGAMYDGTVVQSDPAEPSELPRLQLFMPDDVYLQAYNATTLHHNEGYPAVIAFEGTIYDNVTIRVKGNQARTKPKRKWKVMMPAGHVFDAGGRLVAPVDEFDLLPASTDKSFSREILVSDMQTLSGGYGQQVFPMRIERNNEFYGLYMYGESMDGDWRDRYGFSDGTVAYKTEKAARLRISDLDLPKQEFSILYERYTQRYSADDPELRDLITNLNTLSGNALLAWAYQHVDIPQLVEAIATMRIVQHSEWQHKNHFLIYDPQDELWRMLPIDFDLTFGRMYHSGCTSQCDDVIARDWMDYPNGNMLAAVVLNDPTLRQMVDRRTRTLADAYLAPGALEARLADLLSLMGGDAERDRALNGSFGQPQTMEQAQAVLIEQFIVPKRAMYLESGKYLPDSQVGTPDIAVAVERTAADGSVVSATLTNRGTVAVDVSGRVFDDIGAVMPAGVVILPGATITVVFDRVPIGPQAVAHLVVRATRPVTP